MDDNRAPLLEVRGLTTAFVSEHDGARCVVRAADAVSFDIGRGEILAVAGESGSGKSVTALSILRLVPPPGRIVSGSVLFEGRDLLALDERELRRVRGARIGFVFQEPMTALNPAFTVGTQIAEALEVHGLAAGPAAARARGGVARPGPHPGPGAPRRPTIPTSFRAACASAC